MFLAIEDSAHIRELEAHLRRMLTSTLRLSATKTIGWPSGKISDATVNHDGKYWFWSRDWAPGENPDRFHNWFGHYSVDRSLDIGVEVNIRIEAGSYPLGGLFARETSSGRNYLMHTGAIGGGTKNVGKRSFMAWFDDNPVEVATSGGEVLAFPIIAVEGRHVGSALGRYLDGVRSFKEAARRGDLETPSFKRRLKDLQEFYSEPRGRRKGTRKSQFDYVTRHGEIVDAVSEWRKHQGLKTGERLVKSVYIDVGVAKGKALIELFEIKPNFDRQSIYTAVGQLMVHGAASTCRKKVLVIPSEAVLDDDVKSALTNLEIETLMVRLFEDRVAVLR